MQRGELTRRILEHLMDASSDMLYLFAAIVASPYGASRGQIERKMEELRESGAKPKADLERIRRRQQDFYNIVYQLQRDGFIKKTESKLLTEAKNKTTRNGIFSAEAGNKKPENKYCPGLYAKNS